MTGRALGKRNNARALILTACATLAAVAVVGCGVDYQEIPIETPIKPKLDVSPFQRVLVVGFVAGGSDDVDTNLETVRLLRSQLRTKTSLTVIDADVSSLMEVAQDQSKTADEATEAPAANAANALPKQIKEQKDLEPYERLFANTAYWKKIGEEYQNPLIVTGTVLFAPKSSSGFVQRDQEVFDGFGRRRVVPVRTYMERKGFTLEPKFVFIDGRTGTTMYSEKYSEAILYNAAQNTPALSSYFELMDRLVPSFLSALSNQKIKGTRVLLN
jgi:hypothetical protein